ncbi:MAG: hypothetical protein ISQ22_01930 [Rhizobiales bacterium]|nr:hypothetical protein [Hyphomicrobiales bacterium]MBL6770120.1 hypothetical protein [Hyphomicrobiales bacterium]
MMLNIDGKISKIFKSNKYKILFIILLIILFSFLFQLTSNYKQDLSSKESWLVFDFQDSNLIIRFEYLIENRCSIKEVRYGINEAQPNNILVLPMCDRQVKDIERFRIIPPSTKKVSIKIILKDGTSSGIREYFVN